MPEPRTPAIMGLVPAVAFAQQGMHLGVAFGVELETAM